MSLSDEYALRMGALAARDLSDEKRATDRTGCAFWHLVSRHLDAMADGNRCSDNTPREAVS